MNSKEYKLPDGRTAFFLYDENGIGWITLEAMDFIMSMITEKWIPVSERLPEKPYGCLVTVWDTNPVTMDEFENILPYFVGWDGEQWNDADGEQCPFEVIAWMPLPTPFSDPTPDTKETDT